MCGLVGVAGQIDEKERDAFNNLLYMDALRGDDGTGVASVERAKPDEAFVVKVSGGPEKLFDRKAYHAAVALNAPKMLLLGHNRYKTRGDGAFYNAHPFEFENIVGAHNGCVSDGTISQMRKDLADKQIKYDTDSEFFFHYLDEHGIEKTVERLDTPQWDKYCFTWYDKRDHTINFLRNKERPLYYVFSKDRKQLFWASEIAMLYSALNRKKIQFVGKDVTFLAEDTHLSWKLSLKANEAFGKVVRVVRKPQGFFRQATATVPKKPTLHISSARLGGCSTSTTGQCAGVIVPFANAKAAASSRQAQRPDNRAVESSEYVKMSYLQTPTGGASQYYLNGNVQIYRDDFDNFMTQGCLNCQANPAWGEPVRFLKDNSFVCGPCLWENRDGVLQVINSL